MANNGVLLAGGDISNNPEMNAYYAPDLVLNGIQNMWSDMDAGLVSPTQAIARRWASGLAEDFSRKPLLWYITWEPCRLSALLLISV